MAINLSKAEKSTYGSDIFDDLGDVPVLTNDPEPEDDE